MNPELSNYTIRRRTKDKFSELVTMPWKGNFFLFFEVCKRLSVLEIAKLDFSFFLLEFLREFPAGR